jgi:sterol 3beta-glucosyltransferase
VRLLFATAGSRGDVEPFAVLARRAMRAGHEVRLVAPDHSGADLRGIDVVSMGVDYTAIIRDQGVSAVAALRSFRPVVRPLMRGVILGSARAALDYRPDVLVAHPKVLSAGPVAEALSIPYVLVEMVPVMTPTRRFPAAGTVSRDLGPLNRLTYRMASGGEAMFRRDLEDVSALTGGRTGRSAPPAATLLPISSALLDRPRDWADTVHLTGAWRTDGSTAPADDVARFISDGDFVYAGFGSMVGGDPVARARVVVGSIRDSGARALVVTGLGGLEVPRDLHGSDLLVTSSVPHEAVLRKARAAIHHGGAGTVHAVLAAGTVSVVVPFFADQPFWGARLHEKGLAPPALRQRGLTSERLTAALAEVPGYRPAVRSAARTMAAEDGPGAALEVLERLA